MKSMQKAMHLKWMKRAAHLKWMKKAVYLKSMKKAVHLMKKAAHLKSVKEAMHSRLMKECLVPKVEEEGRALAADAGSSALKVRGRNTCHGSTRWGGIAVTECPPSDSNPLLWQRR